MSDYKKGLERNLWLYAIFQAFHKRAYLAVIVIYAVFVANVSVEQFGFIAAITALVTMILEIPSGYISDKIGHKQALVFGAFFLAIAPLGFVFAPNFYGILLASLGYWGGAAFHSGTRQAFLHETLIELGRDDDFGTVSARAERWSLFINLFLIALVPLTYEIDPRLPFLIGFFLQTIVLIVAFFFTASRHAKKKISEKIHDGFFALLATTQKRGEVFLFFFLGAVTALYNKMPEYKELYFQEIGAPLWTFGLMYSFASIVGIVLTYRVSDLEKYRSQTFYMGDFLLICLIGVLVGVVGHPVFGIGLFVVWGGYYRVRRILVHTYLLKDCPTQNLKATYLSMYSFFEALNMIWVPVVLGYAVGYLGIRLGYMYFGIGAFIVLILMHKFIFRKIK